MKITMEFNQQEIKTVVSNGTFEAMLDSLGETAAAVETTPAPVPAPTQKRQRSSKPVEPEPAEVKQPDPEPEVKPEPETKQPEPESEEPTYTLIQVRERLAELSKNGKQEQVRTLISKFGAVKLSEIKEESYASLMKEAEAL
jgi:hypothetical protein